MKRILILDNYLDMLDVLQLIFRKHNFIIDCCNTIKDMYKCLQEHIPDLMIIDVVKTGADEKVLCDDLRSRNSLKLVPIIITSTIKRHIDRFKYLCADDAIEKPFSIDGILDKVHFLLPAH